MDTILTKLFTKWNIQCGNDMEASYIEAGGLWTIGYLAYGLGGEGGCSPPPTPHILGSSDFFGQREKIWAKPVF